MLLEKEETVLLTQIGFTKTQAKIYFALLKLKRPDVKTLSKAAKLPKPEVYRTLNELQKMGLAEKHITKPIKYEATPLHFGLQILMTQKNQQYKNIQLEIKRFLKNHQSCQIDMPEEKEYKLTMIEGKQRLTQIMKQQHERAQRSVDILSTTQRWMQILDCCYTNYEKALDRGVKYRVAIENHVGQNDFAENVQTLLAKPNFELRFKRGPLLTNETIFDNKEATINFSQGKPLGDSPIIWTNHPSFIEMCKDHFDKVWKSAVKQVSKGNTNRGY